MEETLLVGDHLLVDKLAYAPPGAISRHLLPYTEPQPRRHHRFSLPRGHQPDIRQTLHRRSRRPHPPGGQEPDPQRQGGQRAVRLPQGGIFRPLPRRIPDSQRAHPVAGLGHAPQSRGERRSRGAAGLLFRHGGQPRPRRPTAATGASCRAPTSSASR